MKIKLLLAVASISSMVTAQKNLTSLANFEFDESNTVVYQDSTAYIYANGVGSLLELKPTLALSEGFLIYEMPYLDVLAQTEKFYSGVPSMSFVFDVNKILSGNQIVSSTIVGGTSRSLYTYDANGNLTDLESQTFNLGAWETQYSSVLTYNNNNDVLTNSFYSAVSGTLELQNTETYTYDAVSGKLTEFVGSSLDQLGAMVLNSKSVVQYSSNQIDYIDRFESSTTPGVLELDLRLKYNYTGSQITKIDAFPAPGGVLSTTAVAHIAHTYNADGNITSQSYIESGDTTNKTIYEYLDSDFISKIIDFRPNSADILYVSAERFYRYPSTLGISDNLPLISIQLYPNPTISELNISGIENLKSVQIMNVSGQILLTQTAAEVDVSHLPSGTYLISGTAENGTFTERFIKQ